MADVSSSHILEQVHRANVEDAIEQHPPPRRPTRLHRRRRRGEQQGTRHPADLEDFFDSDFRIVPHVSATKKFKASEERRAQKYATPVTTMTTTTTTRTTCLLDLLRMRETYGLVRGHLHERCLPSLCTRCCGSGSSSPCQTIAATTSCWSSRMLRSHKNNTTEWRAYGRRQIKFRDLETAATDAVLGLDPTGAYCMAVGEDAYDDADVGNNNPAENHHRRDVATLLFLRMFALPSRSTPRSRLMSSVPLTVEITSSMEDMLEQPCPGRVPIRIWLSSDERLGICMVRRFSTTESTNSSRKVSVFLFPLPRTAMPHDSARILDSSLKLDLEHTVCQSQQDASTTREENLLWSVNSYPTYDTNQTSSWLESHRCDSVTEGPAYLFLVDQEEGYRLTWIQDRVWQSNHHPSSERCVEPLWIETMSSETGTSVVVRGTEESRIIIPVPSVDSGWTDQPNGDGQASSTTIPSDGSERGAQSQFFSVLYSSFFCVTRLLYNILTRRPKLVQPRFVSEDMTLPNYSYHLVGINGGRIAEVLLVFSVGPPGKGCRGVYVQVDLLTQDYRELDFIEQKLEDSPPASCGSMALRRRIKRRGKKLPPSEWYPDCVTLDNTAVRKFLPCMSMEAQSAPVRLVYK